jgi:hypothetical protein
LVETGKANPKAKPVFPPYRTDYGCANKHWGGIRAMLPEVCEDHWTEHDGKVCPLRDDAKPFILFRNGATISSGFIRASEIKSFWTWTDPPSGYDVVAYSSENADGLPSNPATPTTISLGVSKGTPPEGA